MLLLADHKVAVVNLGHLGAPREVLGVKVGGCLHDKVVAVLVQLIKDVADVLAVHVHVEIGVAVVVLAAPARQSPQPPEWHTEGRQN